LENNDVYRFIQKFFVSSKRVMHPALASACHIVVQNQKYRRAKIVLVGAADAVRFGAADRVMQDGARALHLLLRHHCIPRRESAPLNTRAG
jgi:hypothetical protein